MGFRTGLWLGELTHFWDAVDEAGFRSTIASPSGGWVPLDPQSLMMPEMGHNTRLGNDVTSHYRDRLFMDRLNHTAALAEVSAADFDAIYLAGGHGTMWDFRSPELGRLLAAEEKADNRDDIVPFNLEEELEARGARYTKAMLPFRKHVVEDGQLITGQNPASARGVGEAVARALKESPRRSANAERPSADQASARAAVGSYPAE